MILFQWLAVPFALTDDAVSSITSTSREIDVVTVNGTISQTGWLGSLAADKAVICNYIDSFLLLIFGGIPWQVRPTSDYPPIKQQMLHTLWD